MKISEIFEGYNANITGKDLQIERLCYDSRKCSNNTMFFAIRGEKTDGHKFIENAIENGAVAVVVEEDLNIKNATVVRVNDTKDALAWASVKFFNNPSEQLTLIGITGTNGKTTISYLLEKIFENTAIIGTVNYRFKEKIITAENTTPLSLELNSILNEIAKEKVSHVIMEVSSHGVELKRVKYLNFNCGVYTNLSHEHLDFHRDMENYFNAKRKFFAEILMESKKSNKFAVINTDDSYGKRLYNELSSKIKILTYGFSPDCDIFPENYKISLSGINAEISTPGGKINVNSNLIGDFNLLNLLAAISVGVGFNIPLNKIEKSLNSKIVIPGRLEKVLDNRNYFVDYAHTPDALKNVLVTLNKIKGKSKIITVFGCGGDRDKTKRPVMGYIAAKFSDFVIVTSDNPRTEDPFKIIEDILEGVKKAVKEGLISENSYRIIPDRKDAILMGVKAAKNRNILLVAGKGHEDYQIIGKEKIHFNDKEIILEAVKDV